MVKKYINFNTDKRKNAANSFEFFFKLMNNSIFGKNTENLRKRMSVKLVNNAKDYVKFVSKPSFLSQKIFSTNFVAIHEIKPVMFNKKMIRHNMKRIQSKLHKIGTYEVCKISLSCFDDKRYILGSGVDSLAYFHKDIKSQ